MKKIIRLSEFDLTRIVKRVINENEQLNKMIKLSISRFISGLKMEDLDHDNIVFVNKDGKTVFRYDLEEGNLYYSTLLFSFVKGLKKSKPKDVHKNVSNIIESWVEENLVPKFNDEFENKFGFEFMIKNVDLDDEYIDDEEEDDDEENYDEENYYVPNDRIYQKRNAYGPGNPNAKKKDSDPMEYLNSFNDLEVVDRNQPQRMTLFRYEEVNNMFVALNQSSGSVLYVNGEIWFTLKEEYGLSSDEIRNLIKEWIKNTFDINTIIISADHHLNINGQLEGGYQSRRK